jgi:hypothetical protein
MSTPKNERMFDLRVVHRYIGSGRVTKEEYDAHLAGLVDVAENVRPREEGGDEDGYDRPIAANEPRRPAPLPIRRVVTDESDMDDDDDDDDLDDDDDGDGDDDDGDAAQADEPATDAPADDDTGG